MWLGLFSDKMIFLLTIKVYTYSFRITHFCGDGQQKYKTMVAKQDLAPTPTEEYSNLIELLMALAT